MKYTVNKQFRDGNGKWHAQGEIVEMALEVAKRFLVYKILSPILDAITTPVKKAVESAEKKLGTENADSKNQKKGN